MTTATLHRLIRRAHERAALYATIIEPWVVAGELIVWVVCGRVSRLEPRRQRVTWNVEVRP